MRPAAAKSDKPAWLDAGVPEMEATARLEPKLNKDLMDKALVPETAQVTFVDGQLEVTRNHWDFDRHSSYIQKHQHEDRVPEAPRARVMFQ